METKIIETVQADQAGKDWAMSLKPGMPFTGAAVEARARYQSQHEQRMFIGSAMDVLERCRVMTDMQGILTDGFTNPLATA